MSFLQRIRDWCSEKNSPWFTKKDAHRILADSLKPEGVDKWLRGWEARGDIRREKGSRWYRMSFINRYPNLYATEEIGVAFTNLKAVENIEVKLKV